MKDTTIKFKVEGIYCPNCVKKLLKTMEEVNGIEESNLDTESNILTLKYETDKLNDSQIKNIIESIPDKEFVATLL